MLILTKASELNLISNFKKFNFKIMQNGVIKNEYVRKMFNAEIIEVKQPLVAKKEFTQEID